MYLAFKTRLLGHPWHFPDCVHFRKFVPNFYGLDCFHLRAEVDRHLPLVPTSGQCDRQRSEEHHPIF